MTKAYLHKYVVIFKQCDFFQKLSYISLAKNGQVVQIQKLKSTLIYEKKLFFDRQAPSFENFSKNCAHLRFLAF